MGILEEKASGRRVTLGARCLIGRHEACDLRLVDPRVSSEHASVHWVGDRWELRDLASRNGTWIGDRRCAAGERVELVAGARFSLGGAGKDWTLVDASPPVVTARSARTGEVRTGAGQVLLLPDDQAPIVSVYQEADGRWVMEAGREVRAVRDHEAVVVGGESFVLELPSSNRATLAAGHDPVLEELTLRIAVSSNEEDVAVTLVHDGRSIALAPRSFHYVLLTLGRLRLKDSGSPPGERGWVDREDLCRMLAVDALKLNTDICRLRKQIADAGVQGAAGIVARRAGSGQVRIGIERIEIGSL